MHTCKFVDLSPHEQHNHVTGQFHFRQGDGWFTAQGEFAGETMDEVVAALIELEAAEIEAIGDCMTGCCLTQPILSNFVKKR